MQTSKVENMVARGVTLLLPANRQVQWRKSYYIIWDARPENMGTL
jgi:hypothetical protein